MNLIKNEDGERINKYHKKPTLKKYNKLNLIYDSSHSFYKCHGIKKFDNLSFRWKYSFPGGFLNIYINLIR